jgi:hypothetical protein
MNVIFGRNSFMKWAPVQGEPSRLLPQVQGVDREELEERARRRRHHRRHHGTDQLRNGAFRSRVDGGSILHTKNSNLGMFWRTLKWKCWYILCAFGIFYWA